MAIDTVGAFSNRLNEFDFKSWTDSAKVSGKGLGIEGSEGANFDVAALGGPKQQTFGEILASSVKDVNALQVEANNAIERLVTGKSKDIHETMLTVERADIAFKTMNQVRMKVIEAYKEIMRMQV